MFCYCVNLILCNVRDCHKHCFFKHSYYDQYCVNMFQVLVRLKT